MKKITGKQRLALPLLASGMSGTASALAAGVRASTVSEWRNQPHFIAELNRLRGPAFQNLPDGVKQKLTGKQAKALPLLASGMTQAATALAVGVKASTVSEWMCHQPHFLAALARLRDQATPVSNVA